jgi:hypothetical protein
MITKLKFLKAYFDRAILPAAGATIGKILYTAKNLTGRRVQYVIDLDANTAQITNINAYPADPLTSPGAIVVTSGITAPGTDANLYILNGDQIPTLTSTVHSTFNQSIANGGTITATNVLTNVLRNGVAALTSNTTITSVSATGLTLNTSTGAITLTSNTIARTNTLSYKITDLNEPSVFVTGTITVIVLP